MTEAEFNQSRMEVEAEDAYRNARKRRCDQCAGSGIIRTVSAWSGKEECASCQGRGWMPKRPKRGE